MREKESKSGPKNDKLFLGPGLHSFLNNVFCYTLSTTLLYSILRYYHSKVLTLPQASVDKGQLERVWLGENSERDAHHLKIL